MKYFLAAVVTVGAYVLVMEFAKYGFVNGYNTGCKDALAKAQQETGKNLEVFEHWCDKRSNTIWEWRNE